MATTPAAGYAARMPAPTGALDPVTSAVVATATPPAGPSSVARADDSYSAACGLARQIGLDLEDG